MLEQFCYKSYDSSQDLDYQTPKGFHPIKNLRLFENFLFHDIHV